MAQIRKGMVAGWPDLELFIHPSGWIHSRPWCPIFLEIKNEKGRLSPGQKAVIDQLRDIGCIVEVVRSIDETRDVLREYVEFRDGF